jgi:hypothetical protein
VNGIAVRVLFDSGSLESILTRSAAARAGVQPGANGVVASVPIVDIGGQSVHTWKAPIANFRIGDEQVQHTHLEIAAAELGNLGDLGKIDMLLGADFFLSHHIYVANSQHKLYFTYAGGAAFDRPSLQKTRRNPCRCIPIVVQADDHGTQMGSWQRHQLSLGLSVTGGIRYPREAVIDLVSYLVTQSGARLNAPVKIVLNGTVMLDFSTFQPTRGNDGGQGPGEPGSWRRVLLSPTHSFGALHGGDCQVVSEVATLLPFYAIRDVKAFLPCIPNRGNGLYYLSFEVFVPSTTPARAVGGG